MLIWIRIFDGSVGTIIVVDEDDEDARGLRIRVRHFGRTIQSVPRLHKR
jgi:hypothetical protein